MDEHASHFNFRENICEIPTSTTLGKINFTGIFQRNSNPNKS